MFENAGRKIKILAKVCFWLTAIGGSITGIALTAGEEEAVFLLLIPGSILVAWLSTIMMYAFGELCENVANIAENSYFIRQNGTSSGSTGSDAAGAPETVNATPAPAAEELPDL